MGGMGVPEIIIILMILAVPVLGVALIVRFVQSSGRHRERLAAIEKGIAIPDLNSPRATMPDSRVYLLRGMIWLFVGIALTLALLGISLTSERPKYLAVMELKKSTFITDGTPEDYNEALKNLPHQYAVPPALSLLGLLPIGVGIAYLLFHRAESTRPPKD